MSRGEIHRHTPSQSAASAFLPSRGADPAEALLSVVGRRGSAIRGPEVVRPPSSPLPLSPYPTLELKGGGGRDSQVTHLVGFMSSPEGQGLRVECCFGGCCTCIHTPT